MIFSSAIFLFSFLPVSIVVNLVIKEKYRNIWLILCSVFFYAWSQPQFLWIIFAIILINYTAAILIEKEIKPEVVLLFSLVGNLSGLVYFKYFNFIIDTINNITQNNIHLLNLILPIGISFYTFKGISYVSEVYIKRIQA